MKSIRSAQSFEEATAYHEKAPDPRFEDELYHQMEAQGMTPKDLIARCGIERSYFYHVLNGKRRPGRNVVIRLGFCLQSTLQDMNQLLRLAGHSTLYPKIRRDAAVIFALSHHYTMEMANELLLEHREEPIYDPGKRESHA